MKKLFFLLLLAIYLPFAISQQKGPNVSFDSEEHNFGKIKEQEGKVTFKFTFINTGSEPLILNDVKASCGCTAPDWSKEPVLPGKKGHISVTFDPEGRPGNFTKTISVSSNSIDNPMKMLKIMGDVIPKPQTLNELYPRDMGELRLETNILSFGKIYKDEKSTKTVKILNASDKPLKVTFATVPAYITVKTIPEIFQSNETGVLEITYDASKTTDWDFVLNKITLVLNGKTDVNKTFNISANIAENFSKLTPEQLANAPKVKFDAETYDFGTTAQNVIVEHKYTFKNEGKSDLIIRKVKSTCGCTVVKPDKDIIKPGESSSIKVTFNPAGRNGKETKLVTFISNDPTNPVTRLYINGIVKGNETPENSLNEQKK